MKKPEGPQGPEDKVSVSWLILQRLDDIRRDQTEWKQDLGNRYEALKDIGISR